VNLPLLDDEGRAQVGTEFARKGRESAVELGLRISGPKLADMLAAAKGHCTHKMSPPPTIMHDENQQTEAKDDENSGSKVACLLYCWRGGMRSNSVAWLLELGGLKCTILKGGYKAFRQFTIESLGVGPAYRDIAMEPAAAARAARSGPGYMGPKVLIVGGRTGAGKTEVLKVMKLRGEQILDLEWCANHTGSAFGGVGRGPQPSQSHFENRVCAIWSGLDPERPVWIEDEGPHIGKSHVPDGLYDLMRAAPYVFEIVVPREARLLRLVKEYAFTEDDSRRDWEKSQTFHSNKITQAVGEIEKQLRTAVMALQKRLGGDRVKQALASLDEKDFRTVADMMLEYYDSLYDKHLKNKQGMGSDNDRGRVGENIRCDFTHDDLDLTELAKKIAMDLLTRSGRL